MRVEVYYEGRIEVFDTDRFTEAQPFRGKSMLADFELHYSAIEEDGLWLHAHCYAANAYGADDGEIPEAKREMGWKFQLAGPGEAAGIRSVVMDGATVLMRIGGSLADMPRLDAVSELCIGLGGPILGRICRAREYLANAYVVLASSDALMAKELGISAEALEYAMESEAVQAPTPDDDEDWIGGTLDEDHSDNTESDW
jgi:hypothetical protein